MVYSFREFQVLQEYTKIFKNWLEVSVDIKQERDDTKKETDTSFFIASTVLNIKKYIKE